MLIITKRQPEPVRLPDGVVLHISRFSQVDWDAAENRVIANLARAKDSEEVSARYGLRPSQLESFAMPGGGVRIGDAALAIELGIDLIESWEGVGVELPKAEDAPPDAPPEFKRAEVTPEHIVLVMNERADAHGSFASLFLAELRKRRSLGRAEGNV